MNRSETKRRQAEEITNILGFVTLLVIGRLTGDNGVTYYLAAAEAYMLLWSVIGGGLSDALGRLLRSRRNKGQYYNVKQMRRTAMIFHAAAGLAGSLCLFFCTNGIVETVFRVPYSALILMALSPLVLLRSVSSVLLGYFQGEGSDFPTVISGILRQIIKLALGIVFALVLGSYGEKVSVLLMQNEYTAVYGGMGFAIGSNLAEILVILFLAVIYRGMCSRNRKAKQDAAYSAEPVPACIKYMEAGRWQQGALELLKYLPLGLGLFFIGRVFEETPILEYGAYAGKYLILCGAASSLVVAFAVPLIAKVFAGFRKGEPQFARMNFQSGVHICLVHGIFLAVFTAVMSEQLTMLLCPEGNETVGQMLSGGSFLIVFMILASYFSRFLQTAGKKIFVLGALGAADTVFLISATITSAVGRVGILSLVYGGIISMFVLCVVLGTLSYRQIRMRIDWLNVLMIPAGTCCAAGALCKLLEHFLSPHMDALVVLLVAGAVSGIVYWILLLLFRNFTEQEAGAIAGGRLIYALGQMLHVY